jgi:hypothetical protein
MKLHDIMTQKNEILATQLCQMVGQLISVELWRVWKGLVMPYLGICLKELRNITQTLMADGRCHGCYSKRAQLTHTRKPYLIMY